VVGSERRTGGWELRGGLGGTVVGGFAATKSEVTLVMGVVRAVRGRGEWGGGGGLGRLGAGIPPAGVWAVGGTFAPGGGGRTPAAGGVSTSGDWGERGGVDPMGCSRGVNIFIGGPVYVGGVTSGGGGLGGGLQVRPTSGVRHGTGRPPPAPEGNEGNEKRGPTAMSSLVEGDRSGGGF